MASVVSDVVLDNLLGKQTLNKPMCQVFVASGDCIGILDEIFKTRQQRRADARLLLLSSPSAASGRAAPMRAGMAPLASLPKRP